MDLVKLECHIKESKRFLVLLHDKGNFSKVLNRLDSRTVLDSHLQKLFVFSILHQVVVFPVLGKKLTRRLKRKEFFRKQLSLDMSKRNLCVSFVLLSFGHLLFEGLLVFAGQVLEYGIKHLERTNTALQVLDGRLEVVDDGLDSVSSSTLRILQLG